MNKGCTLRAICLVFAFIFVNALPAREVITLKTGWKFAKGPNPLAYKVHFDDSRWEEVTIPHDWAIAGPTIADGDGNTGKLPWKGEGWYRKKINITKEFQGKRIYLLADGIMAYPVIYVNGQEAGRWDYGYNSFYLDITEFLHPGDDNVLAIHADTRNHDSRWYPGAGIYRKIQMIITDPVHVAIWGTRVTSPSVTSQSALVDVFTTVLNDLPADTSQIRLDNALIGPDGMIAARGSTDVTLEPMGSEEVYMTLTVRDPRTWDVEHPDLYTLRTVIMNRYGEPVDTLLTPFGIRTAMFTADSGFRLNGRRVQLRGVNLHHDFGPLGAAFHVRAAERQLEIMKSMGCNAIRTSHNMAAPELLDLCDRMGILVFDEAFDKYDKKADFTGDYDFEEFARDNMENFLLRDRNHPSVIIWSVGNEMGDVQNNQNGGFYRLQVMTGLVRKFDPSRPVTMACDNLNSARLRHFDFYDVHSWNYQRRYRLAREMEPKKAVIVSESASTVSTRGFYQLPLPEKPTDFTLALQVSSYDLNAPWWAELADDDFMWQQQELYIAGEFVWTGFDYLGEPTPYNNEWVKEHGLGDTAASRSSYFGIVDLCGIPKDRFWLYKSYWKPDELTVHILPHWNWDVPEGTNIPVFVYTNGDAAELFLNGKSLGTRSKNPVSSNSIERFRLMWNEVEYQPGELRVVAYKNGKVIGEEAMKTAGAPNRIRLTPNRDRLQADGEDLSYILVEALDQDGNPCPLADQDIRLTLSGPGKIAGVGNGNPQSFDPFISDTVKLFYGKAMVIIGAGFEKGKVELTALSGDLVSDVATIVVE